MCPPLPDKVIMLYFSTSTETLVCKIQFGTSAQRPSFLHQQNVTRGGNDQSKT